MKNKVKITFGALALLVIVLAAFVFVQSDNLSQEEVEEQIAQALAEERQATDEALAAKQEEFQKKLAELAEAKDAERQAAIEELKKQLAEQEAANESEAGAEEPSLKGELIDDVFLGDIVSFSLDDGDVEKLVDQEIQFNENGYDVHEEFVANQGGLSVLYSAVDDEEFSGIPYLGVEKGTFEYRLVFDDVVNMTEISDDEALNIPFLGVDMQIVEATANEITFRSGSEFYLREGESVEFDGKQVTLDFVSENGRVTVSVDGEADVISEYDTELINGVDVRVEDILVNSREGVARLVLGEDTLIELSNGEEWLANDESPFEFRILSSGDNLEGLVLSYEEKHDDVNDEFPVLSVGDSIVFPNEYLTFEFAQVLENDYIEFQFEFDGFDEELWNGTTVDNDECMVISTNDNDIEVLNEETDNVFVCKDGSSFYEDNNGDWFQGLVTDVRLVNDDTKYDLAVGGADRLRIQSGFDTLIRLDTVWVDERFGAEDGEAESSDVLLASNGVGKVEYDILTPYGAVMVDVESNADNDEFVLKIPSDQLELELAVY